MKIIQRIIALIAVAVIVLRLMVLNTFAVSAAPVIAAEELEAFLATFLYGAGVCTQDQLSNMSLSQMQETLKNGLSDGTINPVGKVESTPLYDSNSGRYTEEIPIYDPDTGTWKEAIPWRVTIGEGYEPANVFELFKSLYGFESEWVSVSRSSVFEKAQLAMLKDARDKVNPTSAVDLKGGMSALQIIQSNGTRQIYYSNSSGVIYIQKNGLLVYNLNAGTITGLDQWTDDGFNSYPGSAFSKGVTQPFNSSVSSINIYGDWYYDDGTPAETDDETIPVIGEAAGTAVTPDMLNPDGTVTIDGTTYYPEDYIDWDKFKDTAIIDLLGDILNTLDKSDVAEPDITDEIVNSITDSVDVTVSDNLSDFVVPTGITSVFPFCLPVDFVRGIQLLAADPVAPVLEIPFNVPEFGAFKGYSTTLTIDFSKYDKYFAVFRWGIYLCFCFMLIFVSTKIVKGAGA